MADFELIRTELATALQCSDRRAVGRPAYGLVLIFRVLVPQTLYTLSDD